MKIYELIYQQLESEILLGNYPPETFLPSESQLAKQFEASRDTIRKALQQLTNHGYIKKVQGKGINDTLTMYKNDWIRMYKI